MQLIRKTARWLFIIAIPVVLLSGTLGWAFNSLWIYTNGFVKYDVSQALGVPNSELDRAASELIAYFNNTRQTYLDINVTYDNGQIGPIFMDQNGNPDQADISHMKDVKGVLWLDYRLFLASAAYALFYIILALVLRKRDGLRDLARGARGGGIATLGLLAFLGFFAVTSFDWFFTTFHEVFFPQGNWQFPAGDHMITMFPDGFWSDATLLVGLVAAGLGVAVLATGIISLRIMNKRRASHPEV
jgi:integral membrane protein (TIGR01906 family)